MSEVVCVKHARPNRVADITPAWLVTLLNLWVIQSVEGLRSGLGYPTRDAHLMLLPSGSRSTDGVGFDISGGYTEKDFKDVDDALLRLQSERHELFAAIMCYYKAWQRDHFKGLGYPIEGRTYRYRRQAAHDWLAPKLIHLK